ANVASPTSQPTNSPYTAPPDAHENAPRIDALAVKKAARSPARAAAKMNAAHPMTTALMMPRTPQPGATANKDRNSAVNTTSSTAFRSAASRSRIDDVELNDHAGQAN